MVLLPLVRASDSRLQSQKQCAWPEGSLPSSSHLLPIILGICINAGEGCEVSAGLCL